MKKEKQQIVWQKWVNPLSNNDDDNDSSFDDGYSNKKIQKVVMTTFGLMPIPEGIAPADINFYVFHTNFTITKKICKLLEDAEGVETLDILSRYRARVGLGNLFDPRKVQDKINKKILTAIGGANEETPK